MAGLIQILPGLQELYSERGKLVHHGIGVLVYGGLVHSIILSFQNEWPNLSRS